MISKGETTISFGFMIEYSLFKMIWYTRIENGVALIGNDVNVVFQVIEYTKVINLSQQNASGLPRDPGSRPDLISGLGREDIL